VSAPQAHVSKQIVEVIARLTAAGVRVSPNGAKLRYSSPEPLSRELRSLLVEHKEAIIAALSVWCPRRAEALEQEADAFVEQAGVGTDPEIAAAAAECVAAHGRKDMGTVRLACHKIADRVKALAAVRENAPQGAESPGWPDLAEAREQGEAAAEECAANATRLGWDADGAANAVLAYLRAHGPTPGEVLVSAAGRAHRPHDDRAFGAVFLKLSRAGLIEQAGHAKRAKGHGTAGGVIWRLTQSSAA
jgi:hypothetical protein